MAKEVNLVYVVSCSLVRLQNQTDFPMLGTTLGLDHCSVIICAGEVIKLYEY